MLTVFLGGSYETENTKPHLHENLLLKFNRFETTYKILKCALWGQWGGGEWIHKLEIFILKQARRLFYCKAFLF